MNISLSPFAPENLLSRDGFDRPVPRQPTHFPHSGWIRCFRDSSRFPRRCSFIYIAIRHRVSPECCFSLVLLIRWWWSHRPFKGAAVATPVIYVWSSHIARVWINRVRLPTLLVVSWTGKINISLSAFAPANLVSRDGFGSPVPRQPAHFHTQTESGSHLLTGFLPSSAATAIYLF